MRRVLGAVVGAAVLSGFLAGGSASADASGGGTQRWAAGYDVGAPAVAFAEGVSPDGATVFTTGSTEMGSSGHIGTLAYDASSGAQRWVSEFPAKDSPGFGRGHAVAVSADGSTLFVTGSSSCRDCGTASFDGSATIAYDAADGTRLWVARQSDMGDATSIAASADGSKVFVYGQVDGGLRSQVVAYDQHTGKQVWAVQSDDATVYGDGGLAVSRDGGTLFVTGTADGTDTGCYNSGGYHTVAYDTSQGTARWSSTFKHDNDAYYCGTATRVRLSPDGSTVFVTGYGSVGSSHSFHLAGTVAYDAVTGTQLWATQDDDILTLDGDTVVDLEVSPDGSRVFVMGSDCRDYPSCPFATVAYDAATGSRAWVSRYDAGGRSYPNDLAVSADGSTVYETGQETLPCFAPCDTAETDAPLVAYDAQTGDERWVANYPDNIGIALAVAPTGSAVYLAGSFTSGATASGRVAAGAGRASTGCSGTECGYSTARYNTGPGAGTFQDYDPALRYNGWSTVFENDAVGGAYRASHQAGDTATFTTPKSASLTWLTHEGPDQGLARVTIDGRPRGVYDLYAATPARRSIAFEGLEKARHTVRVKVLGRKSADSTGAWVALDGFKVKAGSGITQEYAADVRYDAWRGFPSANGGAYRKSGSPSSRVTFDFKGRAIRWITAEGPGYGRARVVIDGRAHTVDLYRRLASPRVPITFGGLSAGTHHLTIRPLGSKDPASRSTAVVLDAFVVRNHG